MFRKYLIFFLLFHWIVAIPQLNLYYTDHPVDGNDQLLQRNCLRISGDKETSNDRQVVYYCMDEILPTTTKLETNDSWPKFTFDDLSKMNVTSEQLYLWSIPIDIIERYQMYLDKVLTSANESIYNCTWPRFGPQCQYDLPYYYHSNLSLTEMISQFKKVIPYKPTTFTCYTHFKCDRIITNVCLDWTEICDGKIDCLNNGLDEENCWQLEINTCQHDEYRCVNGQCIPRAFYRDESQIDECIDGSDQRSIRLWEHLYYQQYEQPAFGLDETLCRFGHFSPSCVKSRHEAIVESIYTNKIYFESENCSDILYFPSILGINNIYFGTTKDEIDNFDKIYTSSWNFYICSNETYYDIALSRMDPISFPNNMTCFEFGDFCDVTLDLSSYYLFSSFNNFYRDCYTVLTSGLRRYYTNLNYNNEICNRTNMYQCKNSEKCISMYRIRDGLFDCPYEDDEFIDIFHFTNIIEYFKKYYHHCQKLNNTFIHPSFYRDDKCDCSLIMDYGLCDDELEPSLFKKRHLSFQHICDQFTDMEPINIDGQIETDETECEQWPCVNFNTYCDGKWNCPKGIDETGCSPSKILNCSENHHLCFSIIQNQFICLPFEKADDGYVDCIGGTDERMRCLYNSESTFKYNFYCFSMDYSHCPPDYRLCDWRSQCRNNEDEQFCTSYGIPPVQSFCMRQARGNYSDYWTFMCEFLDRKSTDMKYFTLDGITDSQISTQSQSNPVDIPHQPDCHRGLFLRIWSNNSTTNTCLCPPAFYGNQCQYQNQRISLAIKFQTSLHIWRIPFAIIISLIDDSHQRLIHSYEQFTYLAMKDCNIKVNLYLFYAKRPKDSTKNYSIHIDIYEKLSHLYRGSLWFPIDFSFLPVHRLAYFVNMSEFDHEIVSCTNRQCHNHGRCYYYLNQLKQQISYCHCDRGWSGRDCSIPYECTCSPGSICLGISADNRSICVCSIERFGPRCYINTACQTNNVTSLPCQHEGQCIPNDDFLMFNQSFTCICKDGFSGQRCEIVDTKLILSFTNDIVLSQSIYIHFIQLINSTAEPIRSSTYRTEIIRPRSMTIYWSQPFHMTFFQPTNSTYYLILIQRNYQQSKEIKKSITSSDRCLHINEIFNETFTQLHMIRRIKYYHLPCQTNLNLSCFYDEIHLCICAHLKQQRLANCLQFQHNMTFDCLSNNVCQNNGQCFQDRSICPTKFVCICPSCYYGRLCQFNTNEFGLSLDTILGYHILPDINFSNQPLSVKISLTITILFFLLGLIDGTMSLITFKNKRILEVGCGYYLISSSISTLFTMTIFTLKFILLLLAQMKVLSNEFTLLIQCHTIDFLLRFGLNLDQWLNASIATERAYTTMQGARFNKRQSKKIAKCVIMSLVMFNIVTIIHDPIYRRLVNEGNDYNEIRRTWCIIDYTSQLQIYNYSINTIHLFGPFLINLISVVLLMRKKTQLQLKMSKNQTFKKLLIKQFQEHKHLLIAPIVLIILALPRLLINFITKCMKSPNDLWLPLLGYFISFIPTILTFLVFVLPSKFYRKIFMKTVKQYRTNLRAKFH